MLIATACDNQVTEPPEEELPAETTFIPFDQNDSKANATSSVKRQSPYACYVTTLNRATAEHPYQLNKFWVKFPKGIEKKANGKKKHILYVLRDKRAGSHAQPYGEFSKAVRVVRCDIPDSDKAQKILKKEFKKFGSQSWMKDLENPQEVATGNKEDSDPSQSGWYCARYTHIFTWTQTYGWYYQGFECDQWEYAGPGGGDNGGDGVPDNEPCQDDDGNTMITCTPDPGGGGGGEDDGDDSALEIIIEKTFSDNPCLSSVYNQAGQAPTFENILKNFDGEFSVANLILSAGIDSRYPGANAYTYKPVNYNIEVMFNPNNLNRPSLDIARTLMHELIHAEMYRKLLSVAQAPNLDYPGYTLEHWQNFVHDLRNDFPGLYDYYMRYEWDIPAGQEPSSAQHEQMAQHYRDLIEQGMKEFDNTLPPEVYEALAWAGLIGTGDEIDSETGLPENPTVAWENLTDQERLNIISSIQNFHSSNPSCSN